MSLSRRFFLFGSLATALTKSAVSAPFLPSEEKKPAALEVLPYGTPRIRDNNPRLLTDSIARQLQKAGLKVPDLQLFEETEPLLYRILAKVDRASKDVNSAIGIQEMLLEGKMIPPQKTALHRLLGLDDYYQVIGIPPNEAGADFVARAVADRSKNKVLNTFCQCGKTHSQMSSLYPEFRVFAALHETAHYVNARKGFSTEIAKEIESKERVANNEKSLLEINVNERIADATATLYILSNYEDGQSLITMVENFRNASSEPSHYTASTIAKAVEAYQANPHKGISIVEATAIAADIIRQSHGIAFELDQASRTYEALLNGTANPEAPTMKKAILGRRALFSTLRDGPSA